MDSKWVLDGLVIKGEHAMKGIDEDLDLCQGRQGLASFIIFMIDTRKHKPLTILRLELPMRYNPQRTSAE